MAQLSDILERVQDVVVDLPNSTVKHLTTYVQEAQKELEDAHNFRAMHKETGAKTQLGVRELVDKPADWIRVRGHPLYFEGDGSTVPMAWIGVPDHVVEVYNESLQTETGPPEGLVEGIDNFRVYPLPDNLSVAGTFSSDGSYDVRIPYFGRLDALVDTTDSNWFSDNEPEYLIARAASECFTMNKDGDDAFIWSAKARELKSRAIRSDKRSRNPSSFTLNVRAGAGRRSRRQRRRL